MLVRTWLPFSGIRLRYVSGQRGGGAMHRGAELFSSGSLNTSEVGSKTEFTETQADRRVGHTGTLQ